MPKRRLGFSTLTLLVIANMIGAGVFTTSGFALADLGSPDQVMLAWLAGGVLAMCGALSYGLLSTHINGSGGEYFFLSRLMHPLLGFIAGCVSLVAGFTGAIAIAALAFEVYVDPMILPVDLPSGSIAVLLVVAAAIFHGVRGSLGTVVQNITVGLKLLLILAFIIAAIIFASSKHEAAAAPIGSGFSLFGFAGTLVWISLSFSGYNAAVYIAGEAETKGRVIIRSMWVGTLLVTILYLLLNGIFVYLVPFELAVGKPDIAAVAAMHIGGEPLSLLIRVIIGVSLLTSVFAMVMIGPRVYAQMADDGLFPQFLKFKDEVPRASILVQAIAAILVISFSNIKDLLSYLGLTLSLCSALTVASLFIIERRKNGTIKTVLYPWVPGIFIVATLALAALSAWQRPTEILAAFLTFLGSGILYFLIRSRQH